MVLIVFLNKLKNISKKKEEGFTFVEVLVAMLIFALILVFMLQSTLLAYKINLSKHVKSMARDLVYEELEKLRNMPYSNISSINCPEPCTTNPSNTDCKLYRYVISSNVTFGKSIKVEQDSSDSHISKITVTICSDFKDWRTKNPISYNATTIISDTGD